MDFGYIRPETVSNASLAARNGDFEALKRIVEKNKDNDDNDAEAAERINSDWKNVDNRGWGPLHHAAYMGNSRCVELLGNCESLDLNMPTWEGETALFLACKNLPRSKEAVRSLLKLNANVNRYTNEQCSPLQYAAVKADLSVVKWLVRKGARVNQTNVWGESSLHTTMKKSGEETTERIEIVQYLLKHNAKIICFDENRLTPLMLAAQKGFHRICELLLTFDKSNRDEIASHANLRAEDGATALMMASQGGKLECVKSLLNFGADPNISADDGTYAVHLACIARQNSKELLEMIIPLTGILNISEACNLKEPDFMPKYPDKKVLSPFQLAIEWENWDSLDVLSRYLDSRSFLTPVDNCFIHRDVCPDERGYCDMYPYKVRNPLSLLLSERLNDKILSKLPLFVNNITESKSIPPLLTLLTSCSADPNTDAFSSVKLCGRAFQFLVDHGSLLNQEDLLPVFLFSSVSGIFKLIQTGLINPYQLISSEYIDKTRQLLDRDFNVSLSNRIFEAPLLAHRLLSCAIIATYCSLLQSDWVQNLAILVLNQLKSVLSIERLVVIDKMYKNLRIPKTLQELARNEVHKNLMMLPSRALTKLKLPSQIKEFLLYKEINVDEMILDYKETINHINDNGISHMVHV